MEKVDNFIPNFQMPLLGTKKEDKPIIINRFLYTIQSQSQLFWEAGSQHRGSLLTLFGPPPKNLLMEVDPPRLGQAHARRLYPPIVTDVGGICRTDVYCVYCAIADLLFQRQKLQKRHSVHKSNINALCGSCTRQSHGNINLKHPSRLEAHPLASHLVQVSVVKRLSCILLQLQKRLWKKGSLFTNGQT